MTVSTGQLPGDAKLLEELNKDTVYLAIDPGKSNGVCGYNSKYQLQFMITVPSTKMIGFLQDFTNLEKCIIEGYRLYPQKLKEQIYSDLETPRIIGRVEHWTEINKIELINQPASIKLTGYKWLGKKPLPKSNPLNHQMDAHVHFIYWGVKSGRIKLEDLRKDVKN